MHCFNNTKRDVFNNSFYKLGLPYRIQWIFNTEASREGIAEIMNSTVLPSPDWWESHCYLVNGYGFPEIIQEPAPFCSFDSNYALWWSLIQMTFTFTMKYRRVEFWDWMQPSYFSSMSNLFNEIRSTTELFADTETVNLQTYLFAQQLALLKELAVECTSELTDIVSPPKFSTWSRFRWSLRKWWERLVQRWTLVVWSLWESIKMHTVDRHKRRKPLMRLGIWTPSNTIGDKILFN